MAECFLCDGGEDGPPTALEWSETAKAFLHEACLRLALRERTEYDGAWHRLAYEFGMQRSAPGRRAFECAQGHAYTAANSFLNAQGIQLCRACRQEQDRRQRQQNPERFREANRRRGKCFAIAVPEALGNAVEAQAKAAGLSIAAYVKQVLLERLPEWEKRYR